MEMYKRLTETDFKGEWTLKDRQGEDLPLYYMNYRDVQAIKTAIQRLAPMKILDCHRRRCGGLSRPETKDW